MPIYRKVPETLALNRTGRRSDVQPDLFEGVALQPLVGNDVQPEKALAVEGELGQEEPGLWRFRIEYLPLPDF